METPTPPASPSPEKQCQYCCRPLKGRTDKRFCNDDCRNNFNRAKRRKITDQAPDTIPEIIRIIKRNYQILLTNFDFQTDPEHEYGIHIDEFLKLGINVRFYTSVEERRGKLWKFCFDRGWYIIGRAAYIRFDAYKAAI